MKTITHRSKWLQVGILCAALVVLVICKHEAPQNEPNAASVACITANNQFAVEMYRQFLETNENLFFSPLGTSECLGMLYAGAKGSTRKEIEGVCHFDEADAIHGFKILNDTLRANTDMDGNELFVASSIWVQSGHNILSSYVKDVQRGFRCQVGGIDFKMNAGDVASKINAWASSQTKGRVANIRLPQDFYDSSEFLAVNVISFKGQWAQKFDAGQTTKQEFWNGYQNIRTSMMKTSGRFHYSMHMQAPLTCQILELPYKDERFSFIIVLPIEKDGLHHLENSLTYSVLQSLIAADAEEDLQVIIPRFEIKNDLVLTSELKFLGITNTFGPEANFSGIDGARELHVSSIVQQAEIKVDENGTEASASTATSLLASMEMVFDANHPFFFLIRDNTSGSIVFLGRIVTVE